jgi:hypothetical protein
MYLELPNIEMKVIVGLAQLVRFLVMELTHQI